jgi:hypothetical protein
LQSFRQRLDLPQGLPRQSDAAGFGPGAILTFAFTWNLDAIESWCRGAVAQIIENLLSYAL